MREIRALRRIAAAWGAARVAVPSLVLLLPTIATAGMPSIVEKRDIYNLADPVQGDWIRPADVMYIADSESLGYFGDNIYKAMSAERDPHSGRLLSVWTYWACGADVPSWLRGATSYCGIRSCNGAGDCARDHGPDDRPAHVTYGPIRRYLAVVKPRLTIVSLGTNILTTHDFRNPDFYEFYLATAGRLVSEITSTGSHCIWIGPPQAALATQPVDKYEKFVADLGRVAEQHNCRFIDSNPLSDRKYVLKRDREGTHYQSAGEIAWAEKVWVRLEPLLKAAMQP
jgi:hypothetical protein